MRRGHSFLESGPARLHAGTAWQQPLSPSHNDRYQAPVWSDMKIPCSNIISQLLISKAFAGTKCLRWLEHDLVIVYDLSGHR